MEPVFQWFQWTIRTSFKLFLNFTGNQLRNLINYSTCNIYSRLNHLTAVCVVKMHADNVYFNDVMIFIADRGCTTGDQSRAVALQKTISFQVMACLLIPLYIVNSANSSLQSSSSFAILDKNILSCWNPPLWKSEGNWCELIFAKTCGTVTRYKTNSWLARRN